MAGPCLAPELVLGRGGTGVGRGGPVFGLVGPGLVLELVSGFEGPGGGICLVPDVGWGESGPESGALP